MPRKDSRRIYDDTYRWQGWGGPLALGSGQCRLRIFDLRRGAGSATPHLKPFVIVVSDVADSAVTVRSCAGHVATSVAKDFGIPPNRMVYIEHYPATSYGEKNEYVLAEKLELVEFHWVEGKAIRPSWRRVPPPISDMVRELMAEC